ncbi:TRAP transporter small permease [Thalassospira lucentensis]|uniref:TRAP transporter small permease protein n=1 Tax=Thalassospira lucentensis TaxID=168935 RepID=A0A358HQL3_9PROT|nr:TRAP transporter small permease [Thalassospira lucentensis]HBU97441.1 TRAP transporter small permease [Thalassospira lucentensis]HCW68080.1 TRAP transporter small permease [Thalassospira lucentensis]
MTMRLSFVRSVFLRFMGFVNRSNELCVISLFTVFVTLTIAQIVLRYVFSASIDWADEVSRASFIWMVFIAASRLVQKEGAHITLELLRGKPESVTEKLINIFVNLVIALFSALMIFYGERLMTLNAFTTAPATGFSMAIYQSIFVIFGVLSILSAVTAMLHPTHSLGEDSPI